jgi:hypothetical protein
VTPITRNIIDFRAEASGKRRLKSEADYREAQARTRPT